MKKLELYIDDDVLEDLGKEIFLKDFVERIGGTLDETMLLILRAMVKDEKILRIKKVKPKESYREGK